MSKINNYSGGKSGSIGTSSSRLLPAASVQSELGAAIEEQAARLVHTMRWQAGDFSINDNLAVAHYADEGTQSDRRRAGLRVLHRTTIIGGPETVPTKADGRKAFVPGPSGPSL